MAGIGFELKKLFNKKGIFSKINAYFYSTFVTIGPVIISVTAITFLYFLLEIMGVSRKNIELLQATILYSFAFSIIFTSGYCMLLSRYLADRIYEEELEDILPALYGSVAVMLIITGVVGFFFYLRSPLDITYKFFAYLLFVQLSMEVVISIFVSAVKNFRRVAFSFVYGTMLAFLVGYILIHFDFVSDEILAILIGFNACIFLVNLLLAFEVKRFFNIKSAKYFDFLKIFENHGLIFLVNLFYMLGMYIHLFVFWWKADFRQIIEATYVYAPYYDIPATYAFLSIMPTMVIFVVKVETAFYEKYKNYFYLINTGACYEDIEMSKSEMIRVIYKEIIFMMEIQLFFSMGFIIMGLNFLPKVGFSSSMIDIYNILILAYFCMIISYVIMTILLYYDNRKSAFTIAIFFVVTNGIFSLITAYVGEPFYGVGFLVSSFLTVILAFALLKKVLEDIEYHVFCVQVAWTPKAEGSFSKFIDHIVKIGGEQ